MPDELYVLSPGGDEDESGEWVSPRPVDDVVVEALTTETDLSSDDLEDLEAYVDRDALAAHLDGEPADEPLTFAVEGHEVSVAPDGAVEVDPA